MFLVHNNNTNPEFNLALEEYLLQGLKKPAIMLWRNDKSVIVGCNQNTFAEINQLFCNSNGIKVVRRLTGGGAVYHDLGNINYTIISDKKESLGDYGAFSSDLRAFLHNLGLDTQLSQRNDILVNNKKICGNAQSIKNGLLIHHGCILFSTNLQTLSQALKVDKKKFLDKGIKSVKSRVVNISTLLDEKISLNKFLNSFSNFLKEKNKLVDYYLSEKDLTEINKLMENKYSTYEWNYGNSPEYNFINSQKTSAGIIEIKLLIKDGKIKNMKIYGDFFNNHNISELENKFIDKNYRIEDLNILIDDLNINNFILGINKKEFINLLFKNN